MNNVTPGLDTRTGDDEDRTRGRVRCWIVAVGLASMAACTSPVPAVDAPADAPSDAARVADNNLGESKALPPRVHLSLSHRAEWRPILQWPDDCETAFEASHAGDDPGMIFHEVAPRLSVVEVMCAAGSYQTSSTVIRLDERRPVVEATVLRFPVYETETGEAFTTTEVTELWGEIAIDPATAVMTVLNLARQTADCGTWTRYDLGDDAPIVTDARARLPCPGRARPPIRLDTDHPPVGWRHIRSTQ